MAKPTIKPAWVLSLDPTKAVEPSSGKKTTGWVAEEQPTFQHVNWLIAALSTWIEYLDTDLSVQVSTNAASVAGLRAMYDCIVGANTAIRTHATLQAAHDDPTTVSGARILVLDAAAIATRVSITKASIEIIFKPNATYSAGGDTVGIDVTGTRVRIRGGRFTGFTGAAVQFESTADYGMVRDCMFNGNTIDINDLTPNTTVSSVGNVVE